METLAKLPERALQLAVHVGDGIKDAVPDRAMHWIETGAALGALKSGTRMATKFVRRNPMIAVAAATGAGLLWYAARRRAKQARDAALDGQSTRIEARRERGDGERVAHARKRSTTTTSRRQRQPAAES